MKFGYQDEFWQIFQKYQIATLNKEKELGGVLKYEVFRPGLHPAKIVRLPGLSHRHLLQGRGLSSQGKQSGEAAVSNQATMKREEQRRWELTEVHWDLPIRQVDPNAAE